MQFKKNFWSVSAEHRPEEFNARLGDRELGWWGAEHLDNCPFGFLSEAILMTDARGRFTLISPNIERLLGYSTSEVKALGTIDRLLGEAWCEPENLSQRDRSGPSEQLLRDKFGQERWLEIEMQRLTSPEGAKLYCCRDISDRKRLQLERDRLAGLVRAKNQQLRRLEQKLHREKQRHQKSGKQAARQAKFLKAIVENIPQAIFVKDVRDLTLTHVNPAGRQLLGRSLAQALGKTDRDLFSPEDGDRLLAADRAFLASGARHQIVEETLTGRDGQIQNLQTQKIPIANSQGFPQYLLKIARDVTALKQSQQALEQSQATHRALLEAIPDLMFRVSRDGTYQACKQARAFPALLPAREFIGKNFRDVLPPANAKLGMDCIEQAFITGEVQTCEYQLADETRIADYEARTVACGEDEVLILVRDISARKTAERALQASENRFRAIFEQAAVGMILFGSDGRLFRANQKFGEIVGYSPEELRSLNEIELTTREDRSLYQTQLQQLSSGELQACSLEKRYRHKDGEPIWVNFTASVLDEGDLQKHNFVAVIQDIRDRLFAEESLREVCTSLQVREAQYRILTDRVPVGIFQTNERRELIFVNPFWCHLTGLTPSEAHGNGWMQALHPEDRSGVLEQWWSREPEQRDSNNLFRFQRPDGQIFWVLANSTSLRDAEGRYQGEIGTVLEVTQHKLAEDRLKRQAERERSIGAMQERVRRSLDLDTILNTTVEEVRQFLQNDRVLIYRFKADSRGAIVAESVREPWLPVLGETVRDPCFQGALVRAYREGRIHALSNLEAANLAPCYRALLERFQVKANLVVPILQGEALWGLLVAHQCETPRTWQQAEIDFLKQLATQVGIATQQSQLYQQLKVANQKLHHLATVDGLTQVANRRSLDAYLHAEWRRMAREQSPLSLILCDIDFFKFYNDRYGHPAGDRCLQRVAAALRRTLKRPADLVARYGGEEFAVVLPQTDEQGMRWIAESLRRAVKRLNVPHPTSPIADRITLSLGGAAIVPSPADSVQQLIDAADRALYQAKDLGRDRFALYS